MSVNASGSAAAPGVAAPTGAGAGGGPVRCVRYLYLHVEQIADGQYLAVPDTLPIGHLDAVGIPASARVDGQWYRPYCLPPEAAVWRADGPLAAFTPTAPAPPPGGVPAEVLAAQAAAQIALPAPTPATAPPRDIVGLVGIATWLWVDPAAWAPLSATAEAGPVSVTATATPVRTVWDLGEGHGRRPVTCNGPGKPYLFHVPDDQQQTGCSYVFQWASDDHRHDTHGEDPDDLYHARASIVWAVTWTATTGETGALADMTTTTAFDLTIGEIQAVVCYDTPLGHCNPTTTLG